jgi:predicted RNA binding protein YcfA (HicA-like mRNA interferase family)
MPKLPVITGQKLITVLSSMGYQVVRQKGSHIRLEKSTPAGTHKITVPNHNPIAKGTLNDILSRVAMWNQISKEELIKKF